MASTKIIATTAIGHRAGHRRQMTATFNTKRYDLYDGDMRYKYSFNETTAAPYMETVPTKISIVQFTGDKTAEFDVGIVAPSKGESVHILVHRIAFANIYDLFHDRFAMIVAEGAFPFQEPSRNVPVLAGILTAAVLAMFGFADILIIKAGVAAALGVYLLAQLRYSYTRHMLNFLRWRAVRKIKKAIGR